MVLCVVFGCSKRSGRDKDISFYRIPKIIKTKGEKGEQLSRKRRLGFLSAIGRADLTEKILINDRICSRHFVSGKPANLLDTMNPDWLPTLNMGNSKERSENEAQAAKVRWERAKQREVQRNLVENVASSSDSSAEIGTAEASTQTELTSQILDNIDSYKKQIQELETRMLANHNFSEEILESNDEMVKFYTGLPSYSILKTVFEFCAPQISRGTKLTQFQEMMLTFVKLRLNPPLKDLAYRFDLSVSTVSRIFAKWLSIMDVRLSFLVQWPDRESLWKTMPQCFRENFGKSVTVIIDCFEVFIDRPSNVLARAATWSTYKHHNTVKVLIGITPQGTISYVSEAWGGRVSDKYLTEFCGFLHNLLPGDVVLADRGFNISDSVGMLQARLHIPAFTKGKSQLDALEVENTRTLANVRIHVERVIGLVRQKYAILKGTLPVEYVTKRPDQDCPHIDKIIRVCCSLCNVCDSLVSFN